ncbi:uncharacterized protein METZ01_LOCUS70202, partial [marine metagenome]
VLVFKNFSFRFEDSVGIPYYINFVDNLDYIEDRKITFILNDLKQLNSLSYYIKILNIAG